MATAVVGSTSSWLGDAIVAARRFAAITAAGAIAGVLVGGVGGRLAMLLIARLNPQATGRMSDDGFRMGTFTASGTFSLLATGLLLGVLAAIFYAMLRPLMVGPRWFRLTSISLGPAVVVGSMLVHTEGVDFTVLQPAALSIALFVALPGLAVLVLSLLAEPWLADDAWPQRGPVWAVLPLLLLFGPVLPVLGIVFLLWSLAWAARRDPRVASLAGSAPLAWAARGVLTVIFVVAAASLARDIAVLT